ncbi:MAG: hypothetical protein ABIF40_02530 [archaeon]
MKEVDGTVTIPTEEYNELLEKAKQWEEHFETEELTKEELKEIEEARKGPFMTKEEFLKRHPELK